MTGFRNPFRRRASPAPLVDSPEDWAVGDWAECQLSGDAWLHLQTNAGFPGPDRGDRLVVRAVRVDYAVQWLKFARWPRCEFQAAAFVKVTPRADVAESSVAGWQPAPARQGQPA